MRPSLRRRHRRMWLLLAVVIPILFGWSILNIPKTAFQPEGTLADESFAKDGKVEEATIEGMTATLLKQADERYLLIELQQPISSPAPALYQMPSANATISEAQFLGSLQDTRSHRFLLGTQDKQGSIIYLKIYDTIQKETIRDFTLTSNQ